jgi:hypothetical protein
MVALVVVFGLSSARADTATWGTLLLGGAYSYGQGGSIDQSYWTPNGGSTEWLAFVYCIDIPDIVYVPGNYGGTRASTDGTVSMTVPWVSSGTYQDDSALVNVAGQDVADQVAWLLDQYGTNGQNTAAVEGLQEAIWTVIYGPSFLGYNVGYEVPNTGAVETADLLSLGYLGNTTSGFVPGPNVETASTTPYLWFSPSDTEPCSGVSASCTGGTEPIQALVARVPEPSSILLLGIFAAAVLGLRRKLA